MSKAPTDYLKEPYSRVLIPDSSSGTYAARVVEFPGCVAEGGTPEEAFRNLEEAALDWLTAALDLGQTIPEPLEAQEFSGRLLVRLPKSLHQRATELAEYDGVSLNQFIVAAVAERLGSASVKQAVTEAFAERAFSAWLQVQAVAHTPGSRSTIDLSGRESHWGPKPTRRDKWQAVESTGSFRHGVLES